MYQWVVYTFQISRTRLPAFHIMLTYERCSYDDHPLSLCAGCYGVGLSGVPQEEDIVEPRYREGTWPVGGVADEEARAAKE